MQLQINSQHNFSFPAFFSCAEKPALPAFCKAKSADGLSMDLRKPHKTICRPLAGRMLRILLAHAAGVRKIGSE